MQTVLSSFSANAIPWQVDALHNRVDFQCFGKGLWKKDVQLCQTMSSPRAYNAICANIQPQVIATMGNPRKSMNLITHSQQTEGYSDLFASSIVLWCFMAPKFWRKKRIFHILQLVGGFNKTEKYAYQIGSFPQVGITIKNRWNHQLVTCLCNYIHHRSFTVKIRPFPTGSRTLFRGKLAVKLRGGVTYFSAVPLNHWPRYETLLMAQEFVKKRVPKEALAVCFKYFKLDLTPQRESFKPCWDPDGSIRFPSMLLKSSADSTPCDFPSPRN